MCSASPACAEFPPLHASVDGQWRRVDAYLTYGLSQTPGGCTRSMSASSPLPPLLRARARHVLRCALEANVRSAECQKKKQKKTLSQSRRCIVRGGYARLRTAACACALVTTEISCTSKALPWPATSPEHALWPHSPSQRPVMG